MSRTLWRIATDTPSYGADNLSGKGAETTGGRWNRKGIPAVYASETRALACLETVVHLNAGGLPLNRYLVAIHVPDAIWSRAERGPNPAPIGWDAQPPGLVSLDIGTAWLRAKTSALLVIPSAIVPEEFNVLINPLHADGAAVTAEKTRRWTYDPRLTKDG